MGSNVVLRQLEPYRKSIPGSFQRAADEGQVAFYQVVSYSISARGWFTRRYDAKLSESLVGRLEGACSCLELPDASVSGWPVDIFGSSAFRALRALSAQRITAMVQGADCLNRVEARILVVRVVETIIITGLRMFTIITIDASSSWQSAKVWPEQSQREPWATMRRSPVKTMFRVVLVPFLGASGFAKS